MEPKPPWRARKDAYLAHLRTAPPSVLLVSACDKVHNARAIFVDYRIHGESLWGRFRAQAQGTLWYYSALVTAFREAGAPAALADELARTVDEVKRLRAAKTVPELIQERPELFDDADCSPGQGYYVDDISDKPAQAGEYAPE